MPRSVLRWQRNRNQHHVCAAAAFNRIQRVRSPIDYCLLCSEGHFSLKPIACSRRGKDDSFCAKSGMPSLWLENPGVNLPLQNRHAPALLLGFDLIEAALGSVLDFAKGGVMRPTEVEGEALQLVCGLQGRLQVNQNCVFNPRVFQPDQSVDSFHPFLNGDCSCKTSTQGFFTFPRSGFRC